MQHRVDVFAFDIEDDVKKLINDENIDPDTIKIGTKDELLIEFKDKTLETDLFFVFYQLIRAISYLHSLFIIHADINPTNVLSAFDHF